MNTSEVLKTRLSTLDFLPKSVLNIRFRVNSNPHPDRSKCYQTKLLTHHTDHSDIANLVIYILI